MEKSICGLGESDSDNLEYRVRIRGFLLLWVGRDDGTIHKTMERRFFSFTWMGLMTAQSCESIHGMEPGFQEP